MPLRDHYDTIIVGGGIAGASLAYFLAERGARDVLLLERETEWARHSTGRSAATLCQLDPTETVLELKLIGGRFLRNPPPGFSESPLLRCCGTLTVFDAAGLQQEETRRPMLQRFGLDASFLDAEEVRQRVPALTDPEIAGGVWVESDGRLDVHEILSSCLRGARRLGVEIEQGCAVTGLVRTGERIEGVRTAQGEIGSRQVVAAAGAWNLRLAAWAEASPIALRPLRRCAAIYSPIEPAALAVDAPLVVADHRSVYFVPEAGEILMSPMDQVEMPPGEPLADDVVIAEGLERLALVAPDLRARRVRRSWAGLRTFSPDLVHVVGEDPARPGFFWLAGQGGYGIETCAAIGALAADLLTSGRSEVFDPARLSPARFLHNG